MIPAYIIEKERKEQEKDNRIQLEIPDYSVQYEEWLKKKQQEELNNEPETVIIIDIY